MEWGVWGMVCSRELSESCCFGRSSVDRSRPTAPAPAAPALAPTAALCGHTRGLKWRVTFESNDKEVILSELLEPPSHSQPLDVQDVNMTSSSPHPRCFPLPFVGAWQHMGCKQMGSCNMAIPGAPNYLLRR